jgi:hypothetical protein
VGGLWPLPQRRSAVGKAGQAGPFGGTPPIASVVQAIQRMRASGTAVMFYPFILMDVPEGNGLINPYTGAPEQPEVPWRGRITTSLAPGQAGSPDGTAAAAAEVATFMGSAGVGDFPAGDRSVGYTGPAAGATGGSSCTMPIFARWRVASMRFASALRCGG